MKKQAIIIAFVIISVNCNILSAQTSKGKFLMGELSYIELLGAGLGVAIPIGEKVSFDALAGYHAYVNKDKEDNDNNERFIATTIGLKLGFTVFLGAKKQKS